MIAIVDYGMGNLRSVQKALQRAGGEAGIVASPDELAGAEKIVLPGVAAFGDAIDRLRAKQLAQPIAAAVRKGTPYLGFCLGLQLLFDVSEEMGRHEGLGIIPGKVVRFDFGDQASAAKLAVPHMGWNSLDFQKPCPMLGGVNSGDYAYFAHSYHVVPDDPGVVVTTTDYGGPFVSSVWRDNVFATQFHPEKSQAVGLKLLANFVGL